MHMYVCEYVGVRVYVLRSSNPKVCTDSRPPFLPLEDNSEVAQPGHTRAA